MGGDVARMGQRRGVYRGLEGKPEGKRPLGRPKRRWEDNIKMDLHDLYSSPGIVRVKKSRIMSWAGM